MNFPGTTIFYFIIVTFLVVSCQKNDDENRPYEFGFNIEGQQHRHEKKDVKGIIEGEFGFITADGIYHVTVYATDENGNFRILSMRNVRVSAPLDGSPLPPGARIENYPGYTPPQVQQPKQIEQRPQTPPPPRVNQEFARLEAPKSPIVPFKLQPTIAPGCGGCGIVKKVDKPFEFQTAFKNPNSQQQGGISPPANNPISSFNGQNNISPPTNEVNTPNVPSNQPSLVQNPPLQQQFNGPTQQQPGFPPQYNNPNAEVFSNQDSPVHNPASNQINLPTPPLGQPQYNNPNTGHNQPPNEPSVHQVNPIQGNPDSEVFERPNTQTQPGQRTHSDYSKLIEPRYETEHNQGPQVSVTNGKIQIPGQSDIQIKDPFPGMQNGLPPGIKEKDITDFLYKFDYEVGFHGHYEKGTKSGAKIGGYFVNGRDGISRIVTYVADENGFRPKVKFVNLGLDNPKTPKEATEKTFGLERFEFVWYPIE